MQYQIHFLKKCGKLDLISESNSFLRKGNTNRRSEIFCILEKQASWLRIEERATEFESPGNELPKLQFSKFEIKTIGPLGCINELNITSPRSSESIADSANVELSSRTLDKGQSLIVEVLAA
jgi:hypothetical protein